MDESHRERVLTGFRFLREAVQRWPAEPAEPPIELVDTQQRLLATMRSAAASSPGVGPGDLGPLLSQVLLQASAAGEHDEELKIPQRAPWPMLARGPASAAVLCDFGLQTTGAALEGRVPVRAEPWQLPEGAFGEAGCCGLDALLPQHRGLRVEQPATEPVVRGLTGFATYKTPGQQRAVQAALLMPPGQTLLINLPTGSGKTLAFTVLALASIQRKRQVLLIVPTTALAIDQEQRLIDARLAAGDPNAKDQLAFHSGMREDDRRAFLRRVHSGEQAVIISSPEAASGALWNGLCNAARSGRLRHIVIDEAHMVVEWGDDFRPDFQLLVPLVRRLRELDEEGRKPASSQLSCVLMSATLTKSTISELENAFGTAGAELSMIENVYVRPQSDYWLAKANDPDEKNRLVFLALNRLPRPLILYTTKRDDASDFYDLVRAGGCLRSAMIRGGDMSTAVGARVLRQWNAGDLDVVIATSAFGLGVSNDAVRTVLHACVPESIDRFYQELGRAGRDGRAAVSMMIYIDKDLAVAERLATAAPLTLSLAKKRWEAMWDGGQPVPGIASMYAVPLTARHREIRQDTDANEAWNMRTLLLMQRAGVVQVELREPPEVQPDAAEDEEAFRFRREKVLREHFSRVAVRVRRTDHLTDELWDHGPLAPARQAIVQRSSHAWERMLGLLARQLPINELLDATYRDENRGINPAKSIGLCPRTRSEGKPSSTIFVSSEIRLPDWSCTLSERTQRWATLVDPDTGLLLVRYSPEEGGIRSGWHNELRRIVKLVADEGPLELASDLECSDLVRSARTNHLVMPVGVPGTAADIDAADRGWRISRLSILAPVRSTFPSSLRFIRRPLHVVAFPGGIKDEHPARLFEDVRRVVTVEELRGG